VNKTNPDYSLLKTRLKKSPHLLLPSLIAWLRGWYYRIKFFLLRQKFTAGKLLRVYGPLNISGPGKVIFGDNCLIISDAIKPVCIRTLLPGAIVSLGDNAGLNGTSIQSANQVSIGNWSNIADAYIIDTPAHSIKRNRRQETIEDIPSTPVIIRNNVWISVQVVILDGVTINDNSVIGACSLVKEDVPANVFAAGNPLQIIRNIDED
jgi:acetyltransferase-like isoleucine patch superfamily enzyme